MPDVRQARRVPRPARAELDSGTIGAPHSLLIALSGSAYIASECISRAANEASAIGQVVRLPADYFVAVNVKHASTLTPRLGGGR